MKTVEPLFPQFRFWTAEMLADAGIPPDVYRRLPSFRRDPVYGEVISIDDVMLLATPPVAQPAESPPESLA